MQHDPKHDSKTDDAWRTAARSRPIQVLGAAMVACAVLATSAIANANVVESTTTTLAETVTTVETKADKAADKLERKLNRAVKSKDRLSWSFSTTQAVDPATLGEVSSVIGADVVRAAGHDGSGVDIAVIDTGIAPVAGLDGTDKVVNGPDLSLDFQAGAPVGVDAFGHGTHMASIAANSEDGIAPGARLVNLKVGAVDGAVDVSQVIAAIDWAVQHRNTDGLNIRVINLAFGTDSVQAAELDPLSHAVESAWRNGVVVVVSAGNSGGALDMPAVNRHVLAVGAYDTDDPTKAWDDDVPDFTARAKSWSDRAPDLVAPGVSILGLRVPGSTVDVENPQATYEERWLKGTGTSQAAAVVSGAVALLLDARPELTPDQVKALLTSSADRFLLVSTRTQGAGRLDLDDAVTRPTPTTSQTHPASTGLGSIDAARGTYTLVAEDGTELSGEVDLQGAPWVPTTWAPLSSSASAWTGGTWNGSEWADVDWTTAAELSGIDWTARTWRARTWRARTWRADLWAGSDWSGRSWKGRTWRIESAG